MTNVDYVRALGIASPSGAGFQRGGRTHETAAGRILVRLTDCAKLDHGRLLARSGSYSREPDGCGGWFRWGTICCIPSRFGGEKMADPTYDELKARVAELEKKTVTRTGELDFRVGEKGGVSVYGLGRFPVTLYYEQWIRLLEAAPRLREFLEANKSRLKLKEK